MTAVNALPTRRLPIALALPAAIVAAAVIGIVLDVVIAAIAHGAGASDDFLPLNLGSFVVLTVVGLVVAGVAWSVIRSRSARPTAVLGVLVPAVVLVSFVPDLLVGFSKSQTGTSWGAVFALMVMHLAVAASGVLSFRRFLPLTDWTAWPARAGLPHLLASLVRHPAPGRDSAVA